jgi:hypothetical protein
VVYNDFLSFIRAEVLPRRAANPSDIGLSGATTVHSADVVAWFVHNGLAWGVYAATHYQPLMLAYAAVEAGTDPFVEEDTPQGRCLALTPELRARQRSPHRYLYIYRMGEVLEDPVLGRLTSDEAVGWWFGGVELFPGSPIAVYIYFGGEAASRDAVLSRGREWVARLRQREPEYRAWSAARLVGGHLNEDDPRTAADVERLLRPASLLCAPDGSAWVYWDDQDALFYDCALYTQLAPDGGCAEVCVARDD